MVKVRFFTTLRDITQTKRDEATISSTTTVESLVALLSKKYGRSFHEYVYDEGGKLKPHLKYLVNGRSLPSLNGVKTLLTNEDTVAILPPVGGG
jgi:molybdopterin synthase sulfur carrier subunit